jgi:putative restriction endonuclease
MDYWGGRSPLTGITEPVLLRASHILPWAQSTDEQRLDVYNGLLLSALWDAAFDAGLVSFGDNGVGLSMGGSVMRPGLRLRSPTILDFSGYVIGTE